MESRTNTSQSVFVKEENKSEKCLQKYKNVFEYEITSFDDV